jgi:hypothetical protein
LSRNELEDDDNDDDDDEGDSYSKTVFRPKYKPVQLDEPSAADKVGTALFGIRHP